MTSDLIPVGKAELTTLAERTEGNAAELTTLAEQTKGNVGDAAELTTLALRIRNRHMAGETGGSPSGRSQVLTIGSIKGNSYNRELGIL